MNCLVLFGRRSWCVTCLVLFIAGSVFITGCSDPAESPVTQSEKPLDTIQASVTRVEKSRWPTMVRSQGSLFADEQSVVGSEVAGLVSSVHVDLGDFVNVGDPLVSLDQDDFKLQVEQTAAQLQQARAAVGLRGTDAVEKLDPENAPPVRQEKALLSEATSSLQRATTLLRQNAISQGEYDLAAAAKQVADARYASALNTVRERIATIGVQQATLSLARERLANAIIRAPMDGFIRQRQVAPGTYISIGQPIVVLVRTHPLRFRGTVPERYAQSIRVGQEVRLSVESLTETLVAKISRVSPALDQLSRSLAFEALVDNSDHQLRTGLFVEAEIVIDGDASEIVIPTSAITEFAGVEKVWKVVDGIASEHEIQCGALRGDQRAVTGGIEVGDVILRDASQGKIAKVVPMVVESNVAVVAPESNAKLETKN